MAWSLDARPAGELADGGKGKVTSMASPPPGRGRAVMLDVPIGAGVRHIVLSLPAPYPEHVAQWAASVLISPWA